MYRILVPTDFSEASRAAFPCAAEQAHFRNAKDGAGSDPKRTEIILATVLEDLLPASVQFEFGITLFDSKSLLDEAEKQGRLRLDSYIAEHFSGLNVRAEILRGTKPTAIEIAEFAAAQQISLIVIATHGRSGLKRLALGSTTEYLLRHTSCQTYVVPWHKK